MSVFKNITASIVVYKENPSELNNAINSFLNCSSSIKLYLVDNSQNKTLAEVIKRDLIMNTLYFRYIDGEFIEGEEIFAENPDDLYSDVFYVSYLYTTDDGNYDSITDQYWINTGPESVHHWIDPTNKRIYRNYENYDLLKYSSDSYLRKYKDDDFETYKDMWQTKDTVIEDKCVGCKACLRCGCPSLVFDEKTKKTLTVVGYCLNFPAGAQLLIHGKYQDHNKFGKQLFAQQAFQCH